MTTVNDPRFAIVEEDRNFIYQLELTKRLDNYFSDLNQSIINDIILWKVNRYAEIDESLLLLLNQIPTGSEEFDENTIKSILFSLLKTKGIGLPMASTILRFRNKNKFQIIDQRVYRIIYGKPLQLSTSKTDKNINKQIELYLQYLKDLRIECLRLNIHFKISDRILYQADKRINKNIPLNY